MQYISETVNIFELKKTTTDDMVYIQYQNVCNH